MSVEAGPRVSFIAPVSDLSTSIDRAFLGPLADHIDVEGKLERALEALGPIGDRDVVVVDAEVGSLARRLAGLGGRVVALERPGAFEALRTSLAQEDASGIEVAAGEPAATGRPDASADVVVAAFTAFRGPDTDELREADRLLRPGGRLLVVHDYGRDDASNLMPADRPEVGAWSRRDGPFLRAGFRIRVVHCWWTFDDLDEARTLLGEAFGEPGRSLAAGLRRPRLSYNLAIYHRSRGDA